MLLLPLPGCFALRGLADLLLSEDGFDYLPPLFAGPGARLVVLPLGSAFALPYDWREEF